MLDNNIPNKIKNVINIIFLLFFLPFLLYAADQTMKLLTRAAGTDANITVNVQNSISRINTDFYHAFSQGGEESSDMITPIVSQVRALEPKLVRLDHIFDYYDVVARKDQLTFNFSKLDSVVNSIIKSGAKPFFSLSYMPPAIAENGSPVEKPLDWNEWAYVVQKTIEHYSGKNNMNLTDIYYEVWNEPDLEQFGGWKTYGSKNYLTLYNYTQIGAGQSKNCNNFFLGGPATTGLYQAWVEALIKSGYRIDFFSWHTYDPDPEKFKNDQQNMVKWTFGYPEYVIKPKIITEFGFSGSKDSRYKYNFAAAHTASVFRTLMDYNPLYVFSFELMDGPNEENDEGWGLITHYQKGGVPKPRYYIYSFMDQIAGNRLRMYGEGTWVKGIASKNADTVRIMLINYDPKGYHNENTAVTVNGLTQGSYAWKLKYLFRNLYSESKTKCVSNDVKEYIPLTIANGEFHQNICISAQNLVILELTKTD